MHIINIFEIFKRKYLMNKIKVKGSHCYLHHSCKISNGKYIILGEKNYFGEGSKILIWDKYICNSLNWTQTLNPSLKIGDNFSATRDLTIQCTGNINIGNDVTLGSNVFICDENHGTNPLIPDYLDQPLVVKDVSIGDGVWIGEKVCILPGVHIGKKAIIGAGAVVTKDIQGYSIAVGNPASVIKVFDFINNTWIKV